jgi:hypothetical protein
VANEKTRPAASAQSDESLHDMGGNIGPASMGEDAGDAFAVSTRAGQEGVEPGTTGAELGSPAEQDAINPFAAPGSQDSALNEDAPVNEYISIDPEPADAAGADGSWEARLQQKKDGGP